MHVFYRITSIPSSHPSPIYTEDKDKLNWLCLKSFVEAYKKVNPKITFLCDNCPDTYKNIISTLCPFEHTFLFTSVGPHITARNQFKRALDVDINESILFQECDYLYRPNTGNLMDEAIQELGMVSPYDHLNFYLKNDDFQHSDIVKIKLVSDTHFRSTERHTSTYGVRGDIFHTGFDSFYKYGHISDNNWAELAELGYLLFVPIPSIATHMVTDWLAPSVNWEVIWKALI